MIRKQAAGQLRHVPEVVSETCFPQVLETLNTSAARTGPLRARGDHNKSLAALPVK